MCNLPAVHGTVEVQARAEDVLWAQHNALAATVRPAATTIPDARASWQVRAARAGASRNSSCPGRYIRESGVGWQWNGSGTVESRSGLALSHRVKFLLPTQPTRPHRPPAGPERGRSLQVGQAGGGLTLSSCFGAPPCERQCRRRRSAEAHVLPAPVLEGSPLRRQKHRL